MDMFEQDGSLIINNMMYCKYNGVNVCKDYCESCMVRCQGANKEEYKPNETYFI